MAITQVGQLLAVEAPAIISRPAIAPAVFTSQAEKQDGAAESCEDVEGETDTEADGVTGSLGGNEDVGRDESGAVASPQLEGGADRPLVAAAEVVHEPDHEDGHEDVDPRRATVQAKVACRRGARLRELDAPAHGREDDAQHAEGVAVREPVAEVRRRDGEDEGDHVDGDSVQLGLGRGVAELFEDGRLEGDDGGRGVVGAEVCQHSESGASLVDGISSTDARQPACSPNPDLPVRQSHFECLQSQSVRGGFTAVQCEPFQKQSFLVLIQEFGILGPRGNDPEGGQADNNRKNPLNDKDPAIPR